MPGLHVKAAAKLNLYLRVLGKRPDGFHDIQTVFERINLFDKLVFRESKGKAIKICCDCPHVPTGKDNLVYKAADALRKKFSIKQGLQIFIEKAIPPGAGLGGGSSDAAATLLGLNHLWQLRLDKKELINIAATIGADVPFFITNSEFCLAEQPRQKFSRIKTGLKLWHILVVPKNNLSTALVYKQFDRLQRRESRLTKPKGDVKIMASLIKSSQEKQSELFAKGLYNDLEQAAITLLPQILTIKQTLYSLGINAVAMSGSGSSVFGILRSRKEGEHFRRRLGKFKDWRIFIVRTC
jgi:4-diphosphocytidyl-2-C-methyl-D-erythritol kinase